MKLQLLKGFRSIEECIQVHPDRIIKIVVEGKPNSREEDLLQKAKSKGILIERIKSLNAANITAHLRQFQYAPWDSVIERLQESLAEGLKPVVLVLDGITDPHNLGAMIRTAAFMGICAVVLPKDRAVSVTDTVHRISSGGTEHVPVTQVTNIVAALNELKEIGLWIVGFSEHADQTVQSLKADFASVLVIGNEEKGMRSLVKDQCDYLVQIKGPGSLKSLNASVAAAVAMTWASGFFHNSEISAKI